MSGVDERTVRAAGRRLWWIQPVGGPWRRALVLLLLLRRRRRLKRKGRTM
jgi:hypothetical protein